MQPLHAECFSYGHQFLNEPGDRPEGLIIGAVRPTAAELVIENDWPALREVAQILDVVMGHAGAAVQAQNRDAGPVRSHDPVPDPPAWHRDIALGRNRPGRAGNDSLGVAHDECYTSLDREIEESRLRMLHHSAQMMPITDHASEIHTMLLPVLNGSANSVTKNPLYRMYPSIPMPATGMNPFRNQLNSLRLNRAWYTRLARLTNI